VCSWPWWNDNHVGKLLGQKTVDEILTLTYYLPPIGNNVQKKHMFCWLELFRFTPFPKTRNGSWGSGLNEELHPPRIGCNSECGCSLVPSRTLNLHISKPLVMFLDGFFTLFIGSRPDSGFSSVHNLQFGYLALGIQINNHTQNQSKTSNTPDYQVWQKLYYF
jgi:hypothetical protein